MSLYAVKAASDFNADYIITKANDTTYICRINPTEAKNYPQETPILERDCWQIEEVKSVTDENGNNIITTKYPYGQETNYNFAPAKIDTYSFEFKR